MLERACRAELTELAERVQVSGVVARVEGGLEIGFRKHPWASRQVLNAGYAFGVQGFRAEYDGQWQHTNSRKREGLFARASNIEQVRFYGFGNETAAEQPEDFFRTQQRQFLLQPSFRFGLDKAELWIGARGKYQHTGEDPSTFVGLTQPYGVGDFGQVDSACGKSLPQSMLSTPMTSRKRRP